MAVLAINQQQRLIGDQFVATFTGVGYDDELIVRVGGEDLIFNDSATIPYLRTHSRNASEARLLVLTEFVPEGIDDFSFQIKAATPFARAWILNDAEGATYQNYAATIEAGKTLELLEFSRDSMGWSIRTKNQAIGEVPMPAEQSMYPENLRDLAVAARGVNPGDWRHVQAFVEVNEITQPNLLNQLYLDTLSATQAIAASVKLAPLTVSYGTFGEASIEIENKVDEAHRAEVKKLTAANYISSKPTVDQLRARIENLQTGGVLVGLVNTLGGFDVDNMVQLLEERECALMLLAMRSVPFGILPDLGDSPRLRGFAVANVSAPSARTVVDLLRQKS